MTKQLLGAIYSTIGTDFVPLHKFIEVRLPEFRNDMLGRAA